MLFKPMSGVDTYTSADIYDFTETDLLGLTSNVITLDVLANDLAGMTLYSIDDASGNDPSTAGQLRTDDLKGVITSDWETLTSGDRMRIVTGEDGVTRIELDISYSLARFGAANIGELEAGEQISISFAYAVDDSSTTAEKPVSWTTVTFTLTGENLVVNHAAIIGAAAPHHALTEDGDTQTTGGQLTIQDEDGPAQESFVPMEEFKTDYGTFVLTAEGAWTYRLRSEGNDFVQALGFGDEVNDDITVSSVDGTTYTLRIVIHGQNEPAVIGGTLLGNVREDDPAAATAQGTATAGWESGAVQFVAPLPSEIKQDYGTFTFDTQSGAWTYAVDNTLATVDALRAGQTVTDSMVVRTDVGDGVETVEVTITGANDTASITGTLEGSVTEDGLVLSTGGQLTVTDPDTGEAVVGAMLPQAQYGTFNLDEGNWSYTLDSRAQSLGAGATAQETMTVVSLDGTGSAVVSVTVTGVNDAATIVGGNVVRAAGPDALTVSGSFAVKDADKGESFLVPAAGDRVVGEVALRSGDSLAVTEEKDPALAREPSPPIDPTQPIVIPSRHGSFTFDNRDGTWSYTVAQTDAWRALTADDQRTDTASMQSLDGTAFADFSVVVRGADDVATFSSSGSYTGEVFEGGIDRETTHGTLLVDDPDFDSELAYGQNRIAENGDFAGRYGTFHLQAELGTWSYTLDPDARQALYDDDVVQDTIIVTSLDGSATQALSVTVHGAGSAITDITTGTVTEDGKEADGTSQVATGVLRVYSLAALPDAITTAYGTMSFEWLSGASTPTLQWTYTLNNADAAVQGLTTSVGASDSFTVDGRVVTITIHGQDDPAQFSDFEGTVSAQGDTTTSGLLSVTDPDGPSFLVLAGASEQREGTYGSLVMTSSGKWGYALDPANPGILELPEGATVTDTFTFHSVDGTSVDVVITIVGADDAPVISADASTTVVYEDGESSISGQLFIDDPDEGETAQFASPSPRNLDGTFGSFTFNESSGQWSYRLATNPEQAAALDLLREGEQGVDTLRVGAADMSAFFPLSVQIVGANDSPPTPQITGTTSAILVEDGRESEAFGQLALSGLAPPDGVDPFYTEGFGLPPGWRFDGASGVWTFDLNEADAQLQSLVQALDTGETHQETLRVHAYDGSTSTDLTVTIHGRDGNAVIDGQLETRLALFLLNDEAEVPGLLRVGGQPELLDLDGGPVSIVVPQPAPGETHVLGDQGWGRFQVSPDGSWTYEADAATLDALDRTAPLHDRLVVFTADGQPVTLVVTIPALDSADRYGSGWGDSLQTFESDDHVDAGTGNDQVLGGGGHDRLIGGDDADQLHGEDGDDVLYGDGGMLDSDASDSGSGEYTGTGRDDYLAGGLGHDRLVGGGGNDLLFGEDGDDWLFGGFGHDELNGGQGNDFLSGGDGNDRLGGSEGDDRLYGGDGNDVLRGEDGNDWLEGGDGDDELEKGGGTDVLRGGGGDDHFLPQQAGMGGTPIGGYALLDGGEGLNTMDLGAGSDTVLFTEPFAPNFISGFDPSQDVVMIDTTVFRGLGAPSADGRVSADSLLTGTASEIFASVVPSTEARLLLVTLDDGGVELSYLSPGGAKPLALAFFDSAAHAPTAGQIVLTRGAVGNVEEGGNAFAIGRLALPTSGAPAFAAPAAGDLVTAYGSFTFDRATGEWMYTLDNEASGTDALRTGEQVIDTLVVHALDGTAQTISVTISGADEPAVIGGEHNGMVTEDGETTASGFLTIVDVDGGDNTFKAPADGELQGAYGRFSFDHDTGEWRYDLANGSALVQALADGESVKDRLVVESIDGSASETIVADIYGSADPTLIGGLDDRYLTQADMPMPEDGTAGVMRTSGHLTAFAPLQDALLAFQAQTIAGVRGESFSIDAQGHWTYSLEQLSVPAVSDVTRSFTVHTENGDAHEIRIRIDFDGSGVHVPQPVDSTVLGTEGNDVMLVGDESASTQDGGGGDDYLAAPADSLLGGAGNDILVQTLGPDGRVASYLDGGLGDDILIASTFAVVRESGGNNWIDTSQVHADEGVDIRIEGGSNTIALGAASEVIALAAPGASSSLLLNFDAQEDVITLSTATSLFGELDPLDYLLTPLDTAADLVTFSAAGDQFLFVQEGSSYLSQLYFYDVDTSQTTLLADFGAMNGTLGLNNIQVSGAGPF